MRTADIRVGEHYAYRTHNCATPIKAEVLETGVERQEGLYRSSTRTVRNGVRVRMTLKGEPVERVVTSKQIDQPWSDYQERERERRQARQDAEQHRQKVAAERARQARVLDDYLTDHGEPRRSVSIWRADHVAALEAADFIFQQEGSSPHLTVATPVRSLRDLMEKGTVSLDDLRPVLADLARTREGA